MQLYVTLPRHCDLESSIAGDLALSAADAVFVIDDHRLFMSIVPNNIGRTVHDNEIFPAPVKRFFVKLRGLNQLREGSMFQHRVFWFAIYRQGDSIRRAHDFTDATKNAGICINIDSLFLNHPPLLNLTIYVSDSIFGTNQGAQLAPHTPIQVPIHDIVTRHHSTLYGYLVLGSVFL
jgi:hypothetical protein